jgi:hypothetical protein
MLSDLPPIDNGTDLSFVYKLDEDMLNLFFEIIDYSVVTMAEMIEKDLQGSGDYLQRLTLEQNQEICKFHRQLLQLYTDYELYEECKEIKFIIESLENYQEKVGSLPKNS